MTRKAIGLATVTLHVKQFVGLPKEPNNSKEPTFTNIDIEQTDTGGLKGTSEHRCLDMEWREHSDWLFGNCRGQSNWVSAEEIDDAHLAKDWLEGPAEATGPDGKSHILSFVENLDSGWTAKQIWGFQDVNGERRYVRNIVVAKDGERVEFKLIYDFIGEEA